MYKLLLASFLSLGCLTAHASLRCDNGIASEGDRTSEVLSKCGAPVSQAVTGYTYDDEGHREFQREEWVYGPKNGMYYFLQFEGERLKRVESKRH